MSRRYVKSWENGLVNAALPVVEALRRDGSVRRLDIQPSALVGRFRGSNYAKCMVTNGVLRITIRGANTVQKIRAFADNPAEVLNRLQQGVSLPLDIQDSN